MATRTRNSSRAAEPRRAPSTEPASITPSDCAVIGTGIPGGSTAGTRPSAATTPAKVATSARSREVDRCADMQRSLEAAGREGVAGLQRPVLQPGAEPPLALLGRAVGPLLRVDAARGPPLDAVVADGCGCVERPVDVVLREADDVGLAVGVLRGRRVLGPHAGVAVGLELEADRVA